VQLRNVSTTRVDLNGYVLDSHPDRYVFGRTRIPAGGRLRVYVTGSPRKDTALTRHWGRSAGTTIFNHTRDRVRLQTQTNSTISCRGWGGLRW
jgi:hypothetical protein